MGCFYFAISARNHKRMRREQLEWSPPPQNNNNKQQQQTKWGQEEDMRQILNSLVLRT